MPAQTWRPWAAMLVFVLAVLACPVPCGSQTANVVDKTTGKIVWGELAPDAPYKTTSYEADDGGLDPYYNLAISFIDSSLPELLPIATVKGIIEGNASIADEWQNLSKDFAGYAACIVIGLLFIIIFPIVACCFCCCRTCGKCGGKRVHHQGPNDNWKRVGFSIALTILSLFVIAGAACTFVTSDHISNNMDGLNGTLSDAADDISTFFDNVHSQFSRLGDTNFQFLAVTASNYVGNASTEVSERIVTEINNLVNMGPKLKEIEDLNSASLVKVTEMTTLLDTLEQQRAAALTDLKARDAQCGCLSTQIAKLEGMASTINDMRTNLNDFKDKADTDIFNKMKSDLDAAIKTEVDKATNGIDVKAELDNVQQNSIQPILDQIGTMKQDVNSKVSKYKSDFANILETVHPYDEYRWYAGLGLACFLLLIPLLFLAGIAMGCCGSRASDKPTERGYLSNCGGILLMAGAGLIFIFAALLMLLTTIIYVFGAPVERYACQSIDNTERIETYTDSFDLGIKLSNISFVINGKTVSTSVSQIMNGCENDKTLFDVFGLKPVVDDALGQVSAIRSELDKITSQINPGQAAGDASGQVDLSQAIEDLKKTVDSIDDLEAALASMKTELTNDKAAAETQSSGAGQNYDPMLTTVGELQTTAAQLKTDADGIKSAAEDLDTNIIPDAIAKLNDAAVLTPIINATTFDFVNNIFGYVQSYVDDLSNKLYTDVGKCTPFYSILNAVLGEAFCHGTIDPMNGFWLAMGWCIFFFMPSLVLAVKLAKYFRTMLYDDGDVIYPSSAEPSAPPYYTGSSAIPMPNNKVAPF